MPDTRDNQKRKMKEKQDRCCIIDYWVDKYCTQPKEPTISNKSVYNYRKCMNSVYMFKKDNNISYLFT